MDFDQKQQLDVRKKQESISEAELIDCLGWVRLRSPYGPERAEQDDSVGRMGGSVLSVFLLAPKMHASGGCAGATTRQSQPTYST